MIRSHNQIPEHVTEYQPSPEEAGGALGSFLIGVGGFAGFLLIALIYASGLPQEPDQTACNLQRVGVGEIKSDYVAQILTPQESLVVIQRSQVLAQASLHPDYIDSPRVRISKHSYVVLPPGMTVKAGDFITYVQGHPAPNLPCHYIPNIATGVLPHRGTGK
ncbi:hypothetical protein [Rhodomicrobium lacus]|uniref:hypothetical protein n=1 Tax=Rhodomicrobium lacus TaxID=2498452 RepID=UPI0026E12CBC|nr:hypothetical protein [Rhodomicrobium lacus]WKW51766.1 hypothetical protein QMO75_04585 [Rhodomicrobium lacus]